MSNNEIKKYIENIIGTSTENSKQPSVALFKLFLISFILLLIYLIYNSFFGKNATVATGTGLNVIGFYYGSVDKNSNKNILINLGQEKNINSGTLITQQNNLDDKPLPEPKKPSKIELAKSINIGSTFNKVVDLIGEPSRKLDVTANQKQSGFIMYVWDTKPRIFMTFYKNNLISKLTQ